MRREDKAMKTGVGGVNGLVEIVAKVISGCPGEIIDLDWNASSC